MQMVKLVRKPFGQELAVKLYLRVELARPKVQPQRQVRMQAQVQVQVQVQARA